jgi:hypothetical protein
MDPAAADDRPVHVSSSAAGPVGENVAARAAQRAGVRPVL